MRRLCFCLISCAALAVLVFSDSTVRTNAGGVSQPAAAMADQGEVYTGTIVNMNGRMASTGFTLKINNWTSDEDFNRYLTILIEGDQDNVLDQIRDNNLGYMSATGQTGRQLLVARKVQLPDGRTRIAVAFERWQKYGEIRNGYRSQDYPFGIMEMIVDGKGKGGGTFIAAGAVDMKRDKKTNQYRLELENFGTYPAKVMGVMRRSK